MKKTVQQSNLKQQHLLSTFSAGYGKGSKKEKSEILDFVTEHFELSRDYASKILREYSQGRSPSWRLSLRGRKPEYCDLCVKHLEKLYVLLDRMGAEKMKAALKDWLPFYKKENNLSDDFFGKLMNISASTIGRLLKPLRERERINSQSRTKAPMYFNYKQQVPVRDFSQEYKRPGYFQGDTVSHHGHSMLGPHHWSLTLTDIVTTWTENEAMGDKSGQATLEAIIKIQSRLPFMMLSFHSDCGTEFMNTLVINALGGAEIHIEQTRGRAYKKNDQAHVEQKNFTHVRSTFGYYRFDTPKELELMNDIYRNEHRLLMNFFTPQRKVIKKFKVTSKYRRVYDTLQTPYQRVMASEHVSATEKEKLQKQFESLNPLALRASLNEKLRKLKVLQLKDEEKTAA
jgi:hypothetical protein